MSAANSQLGSAPPPLLAVIPAGIPTSLRARQQRWAPWQRVWKPKKSKYEKVPCDPGSLRNVSTKDTWWSYDAALAAYARGAPRGKSVGVGFNMKKGDGLIGIDLDRCVDGGTLEPWAREVVDRMQSYSEISPSGHGARIFVAGSIAADWTNHDKGVEVYAGHKARFLTVTGHHLEGTPTDVNPAPAGALAWLELEHRKKPTPGSGAAGPAGDIPELLAEEALPILDDLNISARAREFLEGAAVVDRSLELAIATRELYEATATEAGELRDDVVFSMLVHNPHAWDVATSKRRRSDDDNAYAAAVDYLWEHHCVKSRAKAAPAVLDFDSANDPTPPVVTADSANDPEGAKPPAKPAPMDLDYVDFATLAHSSPPARMWTVDKWLAVGTVTALFGPAGVGKSLLSEQLAVAVANGDSWLGLRTIRGPVIGLFCEDDENELKWRAKYIFEAGCHDPAEASRGLHLDARAGKPNALIEVGSDHKVRSSLLLRKLHEQCGEIRPALVILDNIAQMFAGSEIDRGQVTAFCNQLTAIAQAYDCSVLLLGHPAKAADSEYSGSTAWGAAVRTRLFLERKDDGTLRLSKAKANYSELSEIALEYKSPGLFAPLAAGAVASSDSEATEAAKTLLLKAVATYTGREQATSHSPNARNNLLKLMKGDGSLGDTQPRVAANALSALLDSGQLVPNTELSWKDSSRHKARGLAPGNAPPGVG